MDEYDVWLWSLSVITHVWSDFALQRLIHKSAFASSMRSSMSSNSQDSELLSDSSISLHFT